MSGLSRYLEASNSFVVRKTIPSKVKRFAQELNVLPVDYARLTELEKQIGIPSNFLGSCNYEFYEPRIQKYYQSIKDDPQLSKVYWFLRSRFWFTDNSTRMKQTITALEMLAKNPKPEASRWLIYEASILLSLSLVYLCQEIFSFTDLERSEYIVNLLTTGIGSPDFSKKVLDATYGIIVAKTKEKFGEIEKIDYDKLRIPPPDYASVFDRLD